VDRRSAGSFGRGSVTAEFYSRPALLAMPLVGKGQAIRSAMIFEKRSHLGLDASTVQQDSDSRAWFQAAAVTDDFALGAGDDAVTARQDRLRIEVRESGSQPFEVGAPAVLRVVPGAAQLWCQRGQPAGVARRVRAVEQQATAEVGQFAARAALACSRPAPSWRCRLRSRSRCWARYCAGCCRRRASQSSCWLRCSRSGSIWRRSAALRGRTRRARRAACSGAASSAAAVGVGAR
jgi:hypothetical protein